MMRKSQSIGTVGAVPARDEGVRGWQRWAPYAAVAWSLIYAALGVCWAVSGRGFPYTPETVSDGLGPLLGRFGPGVAWIVVILAGIPAARAPAFMLPIFRSPILLYRMGLGWILGRRFMLLTHTGRRSGKVRQTILAVLRFDPQTKEIMAISAWRASDWHLNLQANPAVQVETGSTRYAPVQRTLSPEEIATFVNYREKPLIFSRIVCRFPGWKIDSSYEEFLDLARTLRGIAFRPIS